MKLIELSGRNNFIEEQIRDGEKDMKQKMIKWCDFRLLSVCVFCSANSLWASADQGGGLSNVFASRLINTNYRIKEWALTLAEPDVFTLLTELISYSLSFDRRRLMLFLFCFCFLFFAAVHLGKSLYVCLRRLAALSQIYRLTLQECNAYTFSFSSPQGEVKYWARRCLFFFLANALPRQWGISDFHWHIFSTLMVLSIWVRFLFIDSERRLLCWENLKPRDFDRINCRRLWRETFPNTLDGTMM